MRRPSHWSASVLLALCCLVTPAAGQVGDCETLGAALTEHSCFHSEYGPFDTVEASPGVEPSSSTANIDGVHTEYRVMLAAPDDLNVVTYAPARSGQWIVFSGSDIPLILEDSSGEPLPILRSDEGTTGCDALPIARTFELQADERYRFILGPHDVRHAILVVEYAEDFLVAHSRDLDGDGYGDSADTLLPSVCTPDEGWAAKSGDCDDADPEVHPGALETCDDVDRNCNGLPNDAGLFCRASSGACQSTGTFVCSSQDGSLATCDAIPGVETDEACNGVDDDCDGDIDEDEGLCTDEAAPTCVRHESGAFCGCLVDADCGSESSARICNPTTRTCENGCRLSPGGNGCPSGKVCREEGGASECVDEEPADPDPGPDTDPDPGPDTDPDPGPDTDPDPGDEPPAASGCSCRVGGHRGGSSHGVLAFALLLFAFLARRRRVLVAIAALLAGCGGQATSTSDESSDDPVETVECVVVLSEDPIEHACSHGSNGPYEPVIAASLAATEAPAVDAVHIPYNVELVGTQEGWVSYQARRDGDHIVFLGIADSPVEVQLGVETFSEAGSTPLEIVPVEMAEECSVYEQAFLAQFAEGEMYRLIVARDEAVGLPPIDLYVEHLGTFSGDSLSERCE